MILIGQYDSSFVRRVGIALTLYGLAFEHRPWSVFGDAEKIRPYNPLVRVPTLVLDDGEVLIESASILDHLDSLVPADRRALPGRRAGAAPGAQGRLARRRARRERRQPLLRDQAARPGFRNAGRAAPRADPGALAALEADRAARPGDYWFGARLGHADIAVAASLRHAAEAHPGLVRRWRTIRRSPRIRNGWRQCRSSGRSASPSSRPA